MTADTQVKSRLIVRTETPLRIALALMLGLGCVSFIEPSPYELFFFLLIPVAFVSGLAITRTTLLLIGLVLLAMGAELLALMPHLDDRPYQDALTPAIFTIYTVYLWTSALLFALIFSRQTEARVALALKAYGFSCVFAGVWGFLSYLNVAGIGDREVIVGRVAGPFKDPNVLGSYCVLGVAFFLQAMILGQRRYRLISLAGFLITLFGGVFLSFSRGSWGATVFACTVLVVAIYWTADSRAMRKRILGGLGAVAMMGVIGGAVVASNETLRSTITDRAKLEQDYDGGYTGRFGNQMRSIPMLVERPLGFGPHRFAFLFELDPHNSYIGAFAAGGWIEGCTFIMIVLSSCFIALRLLIVPSPFRRHAQIVGPSLIALFLQALQIDIDHWRFVFLMLGMLWGMESARMQYMAARQQKSPERNARRDESGLPATA